MSGSGKDVSGMVGISQDEVGAGTFPDSWDLPVGFVGIGLEKSVGVMVHDSQWDHMKS